MEHRRFNPGNKRRKPTPPDWLFWIMGGLMIAGLFIFIDPRQVISSIVKKQNQSCQEVIQPRAVLSRAQLAQLVTIPERSPKEQVREIVRDPYCLLPSLKIRSNVTAIREAYPMESDPDTWVILLYEGDEYAGYRFDPR